MILVNTKTIRIVRIPLTLPIMATSLQWGTLYRHKEATHTQIVRLVCQLWTSTHYMYVSNRVLKVSNNYWEKGIHVNVYVCNLHCTHCGKKYTITVTYFDYIIVAVLSKILLGVGFMSLLLPYWAVDGNCMGGWLNSVPIVDNLKIWLQGLPHYRDAWGFN